MMRIVHLTLAVLVYLGISAGAQTGGQASPKVQSTIGAVKAVSASSLTVERDGKNMMFGVDSSTRVFGRGRAEPRDLVLRNPPPKVLITDFVKTGDRVAVTYRQSGSTSTAVEVRVVQK